MHSSSYVYKAVVEPPLGRPASLSSSACTKRAFRMLSPHPQVPAHGAGPTGSGAQEPKALARRRRLNAPRASSSMEASQKPRPAWPHSPSCAALPGFSERNAAFSRHATLKPRGSSDPRHSRPGPTSQAFPPRWKAPGHAAPSDESNVSAIRPSMQISVPTHFGRGSIRRPCMRDA